MNSELIKLAYQLGYNQSREDLEKRGGLLAPALLGLGIDGGIGYLVSKNKSVQADPDKHLKGGLKKVLAGGAVGLAGDFVRSGLRSAGPGTKALGTALMLVGALPATWGGFEALGGGIAKYRKYRQNK